MKEEIYLSFAEFDVAADDQTCKSCGEPTQRQISMDFTFIGRQKPGGLLRPRVRGFESGPTGFLKNGSENDGCSDPMQRMRLRANAQAAGVNIAGGVFVPGLCRRGVQEDPEAVVHSLGEAVQKTEQLGRCMEGAVEYRSSVRDSDLAKIEAPYRCNADMVKQEVQQEVKEVHGGRVTRRKLRDITEKHVMAHSG